MRPVTVSDVLLAYPADVKDLMPTEEEIPEEFWHDDATWPCALFTDLFFVGVHDLKLHPRDGIDAETAWRHIRAIMGSFQPKHEHKEAACRYLFDQWFSTATWQRGPK